MELTPEEIRVLGCLVEKESATPDQYPLTTNALVNACNQKTSRDPVVAYSERDVDAAMMSLRRLGLARTVRGSGRSDKHKHVMSDQLGIDQARTAVLGVLMLRGAQTVGELRTRTERLHPFESLEEVEAALRSLFERDEPLVERLVRRPGQKEERWRHLLGDDAASGWEATRDPGTAVPPPGERRPGVADEVARLSDEVAHLNEELARLRSQVTWLAGALGVELDEPVGGSEEMS